MDKNKGNAMIAISSVLASGVLAYLTATRVMPSKRHGGKGLNPAQTSTLFEKYSSKFNRK